MRIPIRTLAITAALAAAGAASAARGSAQAVTPPTAQTVTAASQTQTVTAAAAPLVTIYGQLRPRTEMRTMPSRSDALTAMRTRLGVHATVAPAVLITMEVQDVRVWGDELNTMSNPDRIELHQGYIDLGRPLAVVGARVGRQEATYGEERLIGVVDWTTQARAFDGVRGRFLRGKLTVDGFAYQIGDAADVTKKVNERFVGSYVTLNAASAATVEAYLLLNRLDATAATRQSTTGTRISGMRGDIGYRIEGAIQRGTRNGSAADAYMITARGTLHVLERKAQVTLWYDLLSGDDNAADGTGRVFDTLFGTNHKFYGTADLFTNIPLHTANRGLQDVALKTSYNATRRITVNADIHDFRAAAVANLASPHFGNELDVNTVYQYSPKLAVSAGASVFSAGSGMQAIGRPIGNQTFTYIMMNATF